MAEWFKVSVLKTEVYVNIPWVQIPLYPFIFEARDGIEPSLKDLQSITLTIMLSSQLIKNY